MTASETSGGTPSPAAVSTWHRARMFGTGLGVSLVNGALEATIVRSRPSGSSVVASATIRNYAARPAAEWGTELLQFLAGAGEPHLAATVILPREEVIVRTVHLPGVAPKDTASAIELQLDAIHPWDEEPVEWAWWRANETDAVAGVVRQKTLAHYETLFSEAGIPLAAVTFSAAVLYAALRLHQGGTSGILCYLQASPGKIEIYGESTARACYSAGYSLPAERALAVARSELRLPAETTATELTQALAIPTGTPALSYAAALAASAPFSASFANLLPADRRASHARAQYIIPAALGALLVIGLIAVLAVFPWLNERRYAADLTAEIRRLQPLALRVQSLDKTAAAHRARVAALDDFRRRPQADLDLLNELVRILPEKAWTSSIEILPDSVVITGEAEESAPLLKILDSSPFFQNSQFGMAVTRNGQADQFRITTTRRGRAGRTTP